MVYAIFLAKQYQAELHIVHVIKMYDFDIEIITKNQSKPEKFYDKLREIAKHKMDKLINTYNFEGIKIIRFYDFGISIAPAILEYADKNYIDLIVMGSHGHRGLQQVLLGSVASEVIRFVNCPVFIICGREKSISSISINNILVPVDFSKYSEISIDYAKEIANIFNAKLYLLHIIEEFNYPTHYLFEKKSIVDFVPDIVNISKLILQRYSEESTYPKIQIEQHVLKGHTSNEIVKFAENQDIDLIIISSHGKTGLDYLLLGSVTEKIIHLSPCPVFIVKVFGRSLLSSPKL